MKSNADAHALRSFEQALLVARHGDNKFDEADALNMLGKVHAWHDKHVKPFPLVLINLAVGIKGHWQVFLSSLTTVFPLSFPLVRCKRLLCKLVMSV